MSSGLKDKNDKYKRLSINERGTKEERKQGNARSCDLIT